MRTLVLLAALGAAAWSVPARADAPARAPVLAVGLRYAAGAIRGGANTAYGVAQVEARIGVSFGDFGIGLVLRAGAGST